MALSWKRHFVNVRLYTRLCGSFHATDLASMKTLIVINQQLAIFFKSTSSFLVDCIASGEPQYLVAEMTA